MTHKTPAPLPTDGAEPVAWLRTEIPVLGQVNARQELTLDLEVADMWRQSEYTQSLTPLFAHPPKPQIDAGMVDVVFNVIWPQQDWNGGDEAFCRAVSEKVVRALAASQSEVQP